MIDWAIIREKTEKENRRRRRDNNNEEEEEGEERREKVPPSLTSRPLVIREFCAHMRLYAYH
jgi:hypothetical protein